MQGQQKKRQHKEISPISSSVQKAIDKIRRREALTRAEDELLLTPAEVAAVLTVIKGSEVSVRYLPQMIRAGRLKPDSLAGGNSYRYKMSDVRTIQFKPAGRPKKTNLSDT